MSDYEDNDTDTVATNTQYTGGAEIEFDDTETGGNVSVNEAALLASLNFRYTESDDGTKTYNLTINEIYNSLTNKYEDCNATNDTIFLLDGDSLILNYYIIHIYTLVNYYIIYML